METKTGTRELTVKFSLPYNHSDPEKYLETFEPYFGSIHSFYFDLPGIFYAHNPERNPSSPEKIKKELLNTLNFIRLASPHAQTILCLNLLTYPGNHAQHVFNVNLPVRKCGEVHNQTPIRIIAKLLRFNALSKNFSPQTSWINFGGYDLPLEGAACRRVQNDPALRRDSLIAGH